MTNDTLTATVGNELIDILTETFDSVMGIYLDKGTSLFETLAPITAEQASRPVSATCANLAAQVNHTRYYLEVLTSDLKEIDPGSLDWNGSWQVGAVTDAEWSDLRDRLRRQVEDTMTTIRTTTAWEVEDRFGAALAILAHTAYHLGEIRQALCTIQN